MSNTDTIIKCLEMTTSASDGEALNAIRKANTLLGKEKKNWREFFAAATAPVQGQQGYYPFTPPGYSPFGGGAGGMGARPQQRQGTRVATREEEIAYYFIEIMKRPNLNVKTRQFLTDLAAKFKRFRKLTDKQFDVLKQIYNYG